MPVKSVPDGYHTVTPYLVVKGVGRLMEFLAQAFDGKGSECHRREDGTVMHAEVRIGDSVIMMGEAWGPHEPRPATLHLYVPDTDALYRRALAAGATSLREPENQFYGDRSAGVMDPCGNQWWIGTRVEEVPPAEMARRMKEQAKKQGG